MPENVKSEARSLQAYPSDATSAMRIGSESFATWTIGSAATAEILTPTTIVAAPFLTWGQTDILFGGADLDTLYSELG